MFRAQCADHQEVKIALHSLWYHHTSTCSEHNVLIIRRSKLHYTASGIITPLHVSSTCAHHQEVKIALHSLWYHPTSTCFEHMCSSSGGQICITQPLVSSHLYMFRAHVLIIRRSKLHYTASGIITPLHVSSTMCSSSGGQICITQPLVSSHLYMFRAQCAHHQEVKIALHSLWYHHTYRWPSGAQVERGLCKGRPTIGVMIPEAV